MPVSKKRKQKTQPVRNLKVARKSTYLDDFLDEAVHSLPEGQFCLISVLENRAIYEDTGEKYYYILSRDDGKLAEHNEGEVFSANFKKMSRYHQQDGMDVKVVVGYFEKDQVNIQGDGIGFKLPHLALQWKMDGDILLPDQSYYDWNGYEVQPGGLVTGV